MDPNTIILINTLSDLVLKSIMALKEISGKTDDEVWTAIKDESEKTDVLLRKLR